MLDVNLWGVIHGVQTFAPAMLAQKTPGAIVNTGSKQGITCPPGDTAYNVSKAGVKVLTEALAHSLRNEEGNRISAHLLLTPPTADQHRIDVLRSAAANAAHRGAPRAAARCPVPARALPPMRG